MTSTAVFRAMLILLLFFLTCVKPGSAASGYNHFNVERFTRHVHQLLNFKPVPIHASVTTHVMDIVTSQSLCTVTTSYATPTTSHSYRSDYINTTPTGNDPSTYHFQPKTSPTAIPLPRQTPPPQRPLCDDNYTPPSPPLSLDDRAAIMLSNTWNFVTRQKDKLLIKIETAVKESTISRLRNALNVKNEENAALQAALNAKDAEIYTLNNTLLATGKGNAWISYYHSRAKFYEPHFDGSQQMLQSLKYGYAVLRAENYELKAELAHQEARAKEELGDRINRLHVTTMDYFKERQAEYQDMEQELEESHDRVKSLEEEMRVDANHDYKVQYEEYKNATEPTLLEQHTKIAQLEEDKATCYQANILAGAKLDEAEVLLYRAETTRRGLQMEVLSARYEHDQTKLAHTTLQRDHRLLLQENDARRANQQLLNSDNERLAAEKRDAEESLAEQDVLMFEKSTESLSKDKEMVRLQAENAALQATVEVLEDDFVRNVFKSGMDSYESQKAMAIIQRKAKQEITALPSPFVPITAAFSSNTASNTATSPLIIAPITTTLSSGSACMAAISPLTVAQTTATLSSSSALNTAISRLKSAPITIASSSDTASNSAISPSTAASTTTTFSSNTATNTAISALATLAPADIQLNRASNNPRRNDKDGENGNGKGAYKTKNGNNKAEDKPNQPPHQPTCAWTHTFPDQQLAGFAADL